MCINRCIQCSLDDVCALIVFFSFAIFFELFSVAAYFKLSGAAFYLVFSGAASVYSLQALFQLYFPWVLPSSYSSQISPSHIFWHSHFEKIWHKSIAMPQVHPDCQDGSIVHVIIHIGKKVLDINSSHLSFARLVHPFN